MSTIRSLLLKLLLKLLCILVSPKILDKDLWIKEEEPKASAVHWPELTFQRMVSLHWKVPTTLNLHQLLETTWNWPFSNNAGSKQIFSTKSLLPG